MRFEPLEDDRQAVWLLLHVPPRKGAGSWTATTFQCDDLSRITNVLEAALLTAGEPVSLTQLAKLFDPPLEADVVRKLLDDLRTAWSGRSVELAQVASGWRFQARPEVQLIHRSPVSGQAASLFACGHGNIGDRRVSTTGYARRHRIDPRRRGLDQHRQDARRPAMDRDRRASRDARAPCVVCHHQAVSR